MKDACQHSAIALVSSDSGPESGNINDIDDELESIYYENSTLFSQIESEYLKTISDATNTPTSQQSSPRGPPALEAQTNHHTKSNSDLVHLFSSSSEDEKEMVELLFSDHDQNSCEFGGESQDLIEPFSLKFSNQNEYTSFERYWYSDEDLPPLETVTTLDILRNTPSLAYMYDFFCSKIST